MRQTDKGSGRVFESEGQRDRWPAPARGGPPAASGGVGTEARYWADGYEGRETRRRPWQAFFDGTTTSVIIVGGERLPVCIEDPLPPVDVAAALVELGRVCPACGGQTLVGHGSRPRCNQVRPVARHQRRSWTLVGRVRCSACGETHTLLQPELGPYKRYRIDVLEQVCAAVEEGAAKSEVSRQVGGMSLERVGAWARDWSIQAQLLTDFIKLWLLSGPRLPRLLFVPASTRIAALRQLLGIAAGASVFREANRWLSASRDRDKPRPLLSPTTGST